MARLLCSQFCFVFPSSSVLKSLLIFLQSAVVHLGKKNTVNQRGFISIFSGILLYQTPTESFSSCHVLYLELLYCAPYWIGCFLYCFLELYKNTRGIHLK